MEPKQSPEPAPLLSPDEEAQVLQNLLCDDDDRVSRRLLALHYQRLEQIECSQTP